jgi:hypothetical protein
VADSNQILKLNDFHKQLALYMIAHPGKTNAEIGKRFGYNATYISIVKNSDAFKAFYAGLYDKQFNQLQPIVDATNAMTDMALEHLNHKLETIGAELSVNELKEIADMGLKRLGFGALKTTQAPTVNVGVSVVVDRGDLESARRTMAEVHGVGSSVKQLAAPQETPVPSTTSSQGAEGPRRVTGVAAFNPALAEDIETIPEGSP